MVTCWHCGEEIDFRYVDGRRVPIHLSGNRCEGYSDNFTSTTRTIKASEENINDNKRRERPWTSWQTGHARSDLGVALTHPTICPLCGAHIFFHTNGNGDVVFFDELGWPWPKHQHLSTESGLRKATSSSSMNTSGFEMIADLFVSPPSIPFPKNTNIKEFDSQKAGNKIMGVIMRHKNRTIWKQVPDCYQRTRLEVLSVTLQTGSDYMRIFMPADSEIKAGQIIEVALDEVSFDNRPALFAQHFEVVKPPAFYR